MVTFRYNPYYDIVWFFRNYKNRKWLKENKIYYSPFTFHQFVYNIFHKKTIKTKEFILNTHEKEIICYWISSGTWGSYSYPDKIFICPKDINKAGGLQRVIQHEITHLKYFSETENLKHAEKEDFINSKTHENRN